jgi:CBS domain-containing protein
MHISELMRRDVRSVRPGDTVQQAAATMVESHLDAVPVCSNGRLVGVMVERDIVERVAAAGCDPAKTTVGEVMTRDPIYCFEDESERHLADEVGDLHIAQLPVLDRGGHVVGMAALDDIRHAANEP